ncbi:hypothetical protein THIX_70133 [Thiomonas sp. X19]|nr:hypothetical protein [Thiomonas sp. X19]SCC95104.1 hypothetical protein THIX_70133 [Thiomonas sp. X19]
MEKNLRFWLPMLLIMQIVQAVFMTYLLSPTPTLAQLRHAQAVIFAHQE